MADSFDRSQASSLDLYSRRRFIAAFGGAAFAATFLAACGDSDDPETSGVAPLTRRMKHALGETDIPANPKRLVILESTITNMAALGVYPVAARNISRDLRIHPELKSKFEGMVDFGGQDLNLELVISLQPDLILGTYPGNEDLYDRLSQIAPTVLYDASGVDPSSEWKKRLHYYAELTNKQAELQKLLDAYHARIADFKSRMGARLQQTQVSVVRSTSNGINLCTKGGFMGSVLVEAGVRRPPSQDLTAEQTLAANNGGDSGVFPISLERVREADGDVIFLWDNPSSAPTGDEEQAAALRAKTEALKADPLWRQLNAVRQNKLYQVGGHWRGFSILEANMILDDLFKGLLGA